MSNEEYNIDCPACGCKAYEGFNHIECSNYQCKYYPKHKRKEPPPVSKDKKYNDDDYVEYDYDEYGNPLFP